jgi:hypothetical protein
MADMLIVPALELGHPVRLFVLVETHDALVHGQQANAASECCVVAEAEPRTQHTERAGTEVRRGSKRVVRRPY